MSSGDRLFKSLTLIVCLFLIPICLQGVNQDIQLLSDPVVYFGEVTQLVFQIKNLADQPMNCLVEMDLPVQFNVIQEPTFLSFEKNENKTIFKTISINETAFSRNYIFPVRLKDEKNELLYQEYFTLNVLPRQNIQVSCIEQPPYFINEKKETLRFLIENKGNLPVLFQIEGIESYPIQAGLLYPEKSLSFYSDIKAKENHNGYLPVNLIIHTKTIYADSVSMQTIQKYYYYPVYQIYHNPESRYYKLPTRITNRFIYNNEKNKMDWELISYGYSTGQELPDVRLNWYFKKNNANYFNQWYGEDEYYLNIQNNHFLLRAGKNNYQVFPGLLPLYGEGYEFNFKYGLFSAGQSVVKNTYRDKTRTIDNKIGFYFTPNQRSMDYYHNSLFIHHLTKDKAYSVNGLFSNSNSQSIKDKIGINYLFDSGSALRLKSAVIIAKNPLNQWVSSINTYQNDLLFRYPKFNLYINTLLQNKPLKDEYEYRRQFETGFSWYSDKNLYINSSLKYQDLKTDYTWSYNYQKLSQSAYINLDLRFYKNFYWSSHIDFTKIDGQLNLYDSKDQSQLTGLSIKSAEYHLQWLFGKREYNYLNDRRTDKIAKLNMFFLLSSGMILSSYNTFIYSHKNLETISSMSMDFNITKRISQSLQFDIQTNKEFPGFNRINSIFDNSIRIYKDHSLNLKNDFRFYPGMNNKLVYEVSLGYTIPFSVPGYPQKNKTNVMVSVKDPYSRKPVEGALIKLNHYYGLTDKNGEFNWNNIDKGRYSLQILNQPEGFVIDPPLFDSLMIKNEEQFDYQLIKPGIIKVIFREKHPIPVTRVERDGDFYLFGKEIVTVEPGPADKCREITVVLKNEGGEKYQKANSEGIVLFTECLPGENEIMIQIESIPFGYKIDKSSILLQIKENSETVITIELEPELVKI